MPRATSAACEALPPSEVRIPRAASKPATSSASVKGRTRITSLALRRALNRAARRLKTILPLATPGEAATPRGQRLELEGRIEGGVQQRLQLGGIDPGERGIAVNMPSATMSTATRTAACGGRFAERACSM